MLLLINADGKRKPITASKSELPTMNGRIVEYRMNGRFNNEMKRVDVALTANPIAKPFNPLAILDLLFVISYLL